MNDVLIGKVMEYEEDGWCATVNVVGHELNGDVESFSLKVTKTHCNPYFIKPESVPKEGSVFNVDRNIKYIDSGYISWELHNK